MKKYLWLSYPLDPAGPHPPAIPDPQLSTLYTIDKDQASVHVVTFASHTGTHIDSPQHVIQNGLCIHDFAPEDLMYSHPVLVDMILGDDQVVSPGHIKPFIKSLRAADMALFRFGYGKYRESQPDRYSKHCPGFGVDSARYIREECPELRALGLDVSSLVCIADIEHTMSAHNILLEGAGRKFIVIEEMKLDQDLSGLQEVRISPWLVKGMDSGPCTILGIIEV